MPTYIGENKIIDRYLGDKFLEAAYIGDEKVYDPYTEITGYLPLIFKSRAAVALKNYRIHGTADGAGVETENLWDWKNKTINQSAYFFSKEYTLKPNTTYTMSSEAPLYNNGALIAFGIPGESASTSTNGVYQDHPITRTTGADGKVFIGLRTNNSSYDLTQFKTCLTESSTPPETYIPHGYKLPLTVESGAQSQDIPIYIGSSKLGSEEYVDYGEQKVYKRTNNLWNPNAKDASNGYKEGYYLAASGVESENSNFAITEYILVEGNTNYIMKWRDGSGGSNAVCFYDSTKIYISGSAYCTDNPLTFTTPVTCAYIRTNFVMGATVLRLNEGTSIIDVPYLQPTNPPVPLPPIPTYKDENTLSSTETLGEATVKGRIRELIYKRLSYIKSSDGSAYIDTDITGLNAATDYIEAEMSFGVLNYVEDGVVLFGCATAYDGHWNLFGAACNGYEQDATVRTNHFYSYVNYSVGGSGTIKRMRVVTNGDFSSKLLFSVKTPQSTITNLETGTVYTPSVFDPNRDAASLQPIDFVQTASFTVFAGQYYRSADNIVYYKSHRNAACYGVRIYRNDVLIHNLVPVEREDGELGLLDIITNKFYANAGTGTFEKGEYI